MHFVKDYTYHVYNRSNELLFYSDENYEFFLKKIEKFILPYCDILAWCLLPNHFHILLVVNSEGAKLVNEKHRNETQILSKNIGIALSSYTQAINKTRKRKGSLFAHRTIAKALNLRDNRYIEVCFNYIHQNPCISGLVSKPADWKFSSHRDFINLREESLVNTDLAAQMINFNIHDFVNFSNGIRDEQLIRGIF